MSRTPTLPGPNHRINTGSPKLHSFGLPVTRIVSTIPMDAELLAIVDVLEENCVRCQQEGCHRPISKQVHILRIENDVTFIGFTCFRKHFAHQNIQDRTSATGGTTGTRLTPEEAQLLANNTDQFVEELRLHYPETKQRTTNTDFAGESDASITELTDEEIWERSLAEIKREFRDEKGLFPELPGWAGWVKSKAKKLYEQMKRAQDD